MLFIRVQKFLAAVLLLSKFSANSFVNGYSSDSSDSSDSNDSRDFYKPTSPNQPAPVPVTVSLPVQAPTPVPVPTPVVATPAPTMAPVASPIVPAVPPDGSVTLAMLVAHNSPNDCWLVLHGRVYDLTAYAANEHPGGASVITDHCGADGTVDYMGEHSEGLLALVARSFIGDFSTN